MAARGYQPVYLFLSAWTPFLERAGRRTLFGNRQRNDRDIPLAGSAALVCAASRQAGSDLLGGGSFDETVWPERMGRAAAGGTGRIERSGCGVFSGMQPGRSTGWILERDYSANVAALRDRFTAAHAGYFSDSIHCVVDLLFLARMAKFG